MCRERGAAVSLDGRDETGVEAGESIAPGRRSHPGISPVPLPGTPARYAVPNHDMSGLPGIGAGHDREDFIFREDFL
jgi:hypothetical protein